MLCNLWWYTNSDNSYDNNTITPCRYTFNIFLAPYFVREFRFSFFILTIPLCMRLQYRFGTA